MSNEAERKARSASSGWGGEDFDKLRAMLGRKKTDGTPRYSHAEIAEYLGMTIGLVERTAGSSKTLRLRRKRDR